MKSESAEIKPAQCCIKLVFYLTYTMMHGNTKVKLSIKLIYIYIYIYYIYRTMQTIYLDAESLSVCLFVSFRASSKTCVSRRLATERRRPPADWTEYYGVS